MPRELVVPHDIWLETWTGLRKRGAGRREAACIWGGYRTDAQETVEAVLFFDDFGPTIAGALSHRTPRDVTTAAFSRLRESGFVIVADVHSHPDEWVGLSPVDRAHPIEYRVGLRAVVLPHYAIGEPSIRGVGLHEYLGNGRWQQFDEPDVDAVVRFTTRRDK